MRIQNLLLALFAVMILAGAGAVPARADLKIDVTRGQVSPMPIAIPDFVGGGDVDPALGHNLVDVISADLNHSGLFRTLDSKSFIQNANEAQVNPNFKEWRTINAQALVTGILSKTGN